MTTLTYDHNGHTDLPISFPHLSDREMAGRVRMLMRSDLNHEGVVVGARDRILALSKRVAELEDETQKHRKAAIEITNLLLGADALIVTYEGDEEAAWENIKDGIKYLADRKPLIEQMAGALNFILAFYEPQNYLDTNAWTQAEASGRRALKAAKDAGYFGGTKT